MLYQVFGGFYNAHMSFDVIFREIYMQCYLFWEFGVFGVALFNPTVLALCGPSSNGERVLLEFIR